MRRRSLVIVAGAVLLASGLSLSAESVVRLEVLSGDVVWYSTEEGTTRPAVAGDTLAPGDGLVLSERATATVFFEDGSRLDASGPCHVRFLVIGEHARTVELFYGTINRLRVGDVPTGIVTPADVYAVVRNGDLFMRAEMQIEPQRTTVWLREGQDARCGHGARCETLVVNNPRVFLTTHCCPKPVTVVAPVGLPAIPPVFYPLIPPIQRREIYDDPYVDPRDSSYFGRVLR